MDIAKTLAIFGITGTILMGAVGYLIKTLIEHFLNKDVDKFRSRLNLEIEKYKSEIQLEAEKDKIQYSLLQEKRALVISELYTLLSNFDSSIRDLMALFQPAGDKTQEEKAKIAAENGNKFLSYYNQHKIYFNKETCKLITEINEKFRKAWIDFQFKDKIVKEKSEDDLWIISWKTITEEIPLIENGLEDIFRKILGIEN
jgi:hypothetical protein